VWEVGNGLELASFVPGMVMRKGGAVAHRTLGRGTEGLAVIHERRAKRAMANMVASLFLMAAMHPREFAV
jgi:hypothetical protein